METERRFLRPAEFAARYGFSVKHCYRLLVEHKLPGSKREGIGWLIDARRFETELEAGIAISK
jgi:predicted DNA-binding transcriptional regulator AlpA